MAKHLTRRYRPDMDTLLKLLQNNAALSTEDLAGMLKLSEEEIRDKIKQAQADGSILGYQAILSDEATGRDGVQAVIEVKLTPERGGGFDRLAGRISRYSEVNSCYLMSGSYDVMVIIDGLVSKPSRRPPKLDADALATMSEAQQQEALANLADFQKQIASVMARMKGGAARR